MNLYFAFDFSRNKVIYHSIKIFELCRPLQFMLFVTIKRFCVFSLDLASLSRRTPMSIAAALRRFFVGEDAVQYCN